MKNLIFDKAVRNATVILITLLSAFVWLFIKGLEWEAFMNVVFQFCISWLLSYAATHLYLKAYDAHLHIKLWKNLYLFIIALTLLSFYFLPESQ
ncbi:hypothetical protein [Pontibacter virosus]|uniref:Uncharacterized protein n=1 Tax=Pontibacter virosus TaxID=1765052 RepID=A0A2U1ASQ3_9BACT|nr:hypothetical protein [Pontibacter virosus]PVY39297.1 hypothetical protein C8E01_11296 [Pontibacter virosus]